MRYNILYKRKCRFAVLESMLNVEIPDEYTEKQKREYAERLITKPYHTVIEKVVDRDGIDGDQL